MQLALVYDAAAVGAADWSDELGWFRRAVDVIGHKEVAYRLDVQPSNLTDALNERERKDVKGVWISKVRRIVAQGAPGLLDEYMGLLAKVHGYETPKRRKPRTADEELNETRELLRTHAPAVLALVDKEMGR
jgi:hypothetical protein